MNKKIAFEMAKYNTSLYAEREELLSAINPATHDAIYHTERALMEWVKRKTITEKEKNAIEYFKLLVELLEETANNKTEAK